MNLGHLLRHALHRLLRPTALPDCCARVCAVCGQDTLDAAVLTCWADDRPGVTLYGADLLAEEYGPGFDPHEDLSPRCRVCRVVIGGVHHLDCTIAGCTIHDTQRIACPCDCPCRGVGCDCPDGW